jgi:hypothetical protein
VTPPPGADAFQTGSAISSAIRKEVLAGSANLGLD